MGKTKKETSTAIENAEDVIERFGGIRPMAKKIDVAVTTVQGWKKRNVIPAARWEQIIKAASKHDIDLSDVVAETTQAANENQKTSASSSSRSSSKVASEKSSSKGGPVKKNGGGSENGGNSNEFSQILLEVERKAVAKSVWISAVFILVTLAAVFFLLWPESGIRSEREFTGLARDVQQIQGDIDAVKAEQSFLSNLIPDDLDQRIASLQDQARQTQEAAQGALAKAKEISNDVLADDGSTLNERAERLQMHVNEITATPEMSALLGRLQSFSESLAGRPHLDQSVAELSAVFSGFGGGTPEKINQILVQAREQSTALNETFEIA